MDARFEKQYIKLEQELWWFVGRRDLILHILKNIKYTKVLEIGCGTGELSKYIKNYNGIDISRNTCKSTLGDAHRLPFKDASFDLILLLDILEHTEDKIVMEEVYRVLQPNGHILITVPAFKWLWSQHDIDNQHKRRYHRGMLPINKFKLKFFTYWNSLMFPMMILAKQKKSQLRPVPKFANFVLTQSLLLENRLINKGLKMPIGVTLVYLLER